MNKLIQSLLYLAPILAACGVEQGGDPNIPCAEGGKCDGDGVVTTPCDSVFSDMTGRAGAVKAGSLNDAVANAIFKAGTGCPTTFPDLMAKLRLTDNVGCPNPSDGISTRAVSERSQGRRTPDSYRLVVTRQCQQRQEHEMLISVFGAPATGDLPGDFETIGFDKEAGVFNFYAVEGGQWKFMGNSRDMLGGTGSGEKRRCAACHVGGGLVMKELVEPWVDWEGFVATPGTDALISAHPDLGRKNSGYDMESLVRTGNNLWNTKRASITTTTQTVAEVLRPVFCTKEIQLHTGSFSASPVGSSLITAIPSDFLGDNLFSSSISQVAINTADYRAQIAANHQRVTVRGGATETDGQGNQVLDTIVDFIFPTPAATDDTYAAALVTAGVLDAKFVQDVKFVDFTRPVFSTDRCDLLSFAPTLTGTDINVAKIRDGFITNLTAAAPAPTSAAGEFLASLMSATSGTDQLVKVKAFTTACSARDKRAFLNDALALASARRTEARQLAVLEFPETMPIDDQNTDGKSRFDPKTCTLSTQFVTP